MPANEPLPETHLAVLGGGPGGYSAAFRAAELGIETTIIDKRDELGGGCLYTGCVPSKTLLQITQTIDMARDAARFGVTYDPPRIDVDQIRSWLGHSIDRLASSLAARARSLGIERIQGEACFENGREVSIRGSAVPRLRFQRAVIATGSKPIAHPVLGFDDPLVWTPEEALGLPETPDSLLVVGNQYMSIEIARIYASLGCRVTLADEQDQLLPDADADLTRPLIHRLRDRLDRIRLKASITDVTTIQDRLRVTFSGGDGPAEQEFDRVILALGIEANVQGLDLDRAQVRADAGGRIHVDEMLRTSDPAILAAGDVTGPPMLADRAIRQGRVAAEVIAGWHSAYDARAVPMVAFTDPQIAWCGLTERDADAQSIPHAVRKRPWGTANQVAESGRTDGITKIIFDPDTKLVLGVGIAGPNAAEMIAEGCLALEMGAELTDLAETMHPHPTISEIISDVANDADAHDR